MRAITIASILLAASAAMADWTEYPVTNWNYDTNYSVEIWGAMAEKMQVKGYGDLPRADIYPRVLRWFQVVSGVVAGVQNYETIRGSNYFGPFVTTLGGQTATNWPGVYDFRVDLNNELQGVDVGDNSPRIDTELSQAPFAQYWMTNAAGLFTSFATATAGTATNFWRHAKLPIITNLFVDFQYPAWTSFGQGLWQEGYNLAEMQIITNGLFKGYMATTNDPSETAWGVTNLGYILGYNTDLESYPVLEYKSTVTNPVPDGLSVRLTGWGTNILYWDDDDPMPEPMIETATISGKYTPLTKQWIVITNMTSANVNGYLSSNLYDAIVLKYTNEMLTLRYAIDFQPVPHIYRTYETDWLPHWYPYVFNEAATALNELFVTYAWKDGYGPPYITWTETQARIATVPSEALPTSEAAFGDAVDRLGTAWGGSSWFSTSSAPPLVNYGSSVEVFSGDGVTNYIWTLSSMRLRSKVHISKIPPRGCSLDIYMKDMSNAADRWAEEDASPFEWGGTTGYHFNNISYSSSYATNWSTTADKYFPPNEEPPWHLNPQWLEFANNPMSVEISANPEIFVSMNWEKDLQYWRRNTIVVE